MKAVRLKRFDTAKWIGAIRDLSARFVCATYLLMDIKEIWLDTENMHEQLMLRDKNGIWQTRQIKFQVCASLDKHFQSEQAAIGSF